MSESAVWDCIVVGAGVEGSSAAYNMAKQGKKVLMLEQFPLPHSRGSSHGHSRITRYAYEDDVYVHMMTHAFPAWETLSQEVGQQLFVPCGTVDIRLPDSRGEKAVTAAMAKYGAKYEVLSSQEVSRRFPALAVPAGAGAVWDPAGGLLRADRCLNALQTMFRQLGGTVRDCESVTEVQPGEVATVVTSKASHRARAVVLAAGPWTGRLAQGLGLKLQLKPVRISVHYWSVPQSPDTRALHSSPRLPCMIDSRGSDRGVFDVYSLPEDEYPGLIKVALHTGPDIDPDQRDGCDTAWVDREVTPRVHELLPHLDTSRPALSEACIYTNTPDHHPYIDTHPKHRNIVVCAGFSGHGFKLAPAVGLAVAQLVSGLKPTFDMALFRIDRFSPKASL